MKRCITIMATLLLTTLLVAEPLKVKEMKSYRGPSFYGYAANRIVVAFDPQTIKNFNPSELRQGRTGVAAIDALGQRYRAAVIRRQFPAFDPKRQTAPHDLSKFYKIYFENEIDALEVVNDYKALNGVVDAQPVGIHYATAAPNDPQYVDQWHLNQTNDHDMDAPEAWDLQTGNASIIVTVMDTGVRYYHKDLGGANASSTNKSATDGNIWINTAEKNGVSSVDDDGNGYVDDWVGYDFVDLSGVDLALVDPDEDGSVKDNDPSDFNGHGTHCAGNIGALNNNGYGACSATGGWGNGTLQATGNGVKVMALRVGYQIKLGGMGLVSMDAAAEAFQYAADNGARIASCSWGSSDTGGMGVAVDNFIAAGGLVFHAAGNDDADSPDYLDDRGDCISVASTDQNDAKSDFSNYGTWVDISAPGTDILSLVENPDDEENDYVATMSGTSMATPIAASVAALIWSNHPSWTASQVEQQLYDSADNIDATIGATYVGKMGAGRVNAFNAVNDTPISIKLAAFQAFPISDHQVSILWQTASEAGTAGFYVQRKMNSHTGFERLGDSMIPAAGSPSEGAEYKFVDDIKVSGSISYRLEEVGLDGRSTFYQPVFISTMSASKVNVDSPFSFKLGQNYPNPFNPDTRIVYEIAASGHITLEVFDITGRLVKQLVNGVEPEGSYEVAWDGTNEMGYKAVSGVYLYRLTAPDFTSTRKMLLSR